MLKAKADHIAFEALVVRDEQNKADFTESTAAGNQIIMYVAQDVNFIGSTIASKHRTNIKAKNITTKATRATDHSSEYVGNRYTETSQERGLKSNISSGFETELNAKNKMTASGTDFSSGSKNENGSQAKGLTKINCKKLKTELEIFENNYESREENLLSQSSQKGFTQE